MTDVSNGRQHIVVVEYNPEWDRKMTDVSNGRQHIVVVEYNPEWDREFEKESALIKDVLGDNCIAIHHIGSTAVSGLAAKPIIDMMPVVKSLEAVDAVRDGLEALGYEYMGEFGIPGRRYMRGKMTGKT